jgi:3-oxoacyl-[acyl-carrier-protein] synthase-3
MSETVVKPAPAALGRALTRGAAVASVGSALPARSVPNDPIAARIGVTDDWIQSRTGVRERVVSDGIDEGVTALATRAGREALERAGVDAAALDLVIVATFTQDAILPNAAPLVAHELGALRAGAFDVGSACTGFVAALSMATAQIEAGRADHVLVIGADVISPFLNYDDKRTAALFGDGAGAVVVGPAPAPGRIGPALLRADGEGAEHIRTPRDEAFIHMNGHETFKFATANLSQITLDVLEATGLALSDVDLFVYHQANARILRAIAERLLIPEEKVVDAIGTLGNTSAASIPLALAAAERDGRLKRDSTVLLAAFGAGFTWGATTLNWGAADA